MRAVKVITTAQDRNFPSWSPKGDRIAFTSDRDGDYEIYALRPARSGWLTHTPETTPCAWSPDGDGYLHGRAAAWDESASSTTRSRTVTSTSCARTDPM
jgi:hypothetical protein